MIFSTKSMVKRKEPELELQFVISTLAPAPGGNLISAPRLRLRNTAVKNPPRTQLEPLIRWYTTGLTDHTCRVDVSFPVSGSVSCLKLHYPSLVVCGHFDGSLSSHQVSSNRLNMELDLQSLFGLHVHSCTHWPRPRNSPLPHLGSYKLGRYWSAKVDDISLWPPGLQQ